MSTPFMCQWTADGPCQRVATWKAVATAKWQERGQPKGEADLCGVHYQELRVQRWVGEGRAIPRPMSEREELRRHQISAGDARPGVSLATCSCGWDAPGPSVDDAFAEAKAHLERVALMARMRAIESGWTC